MNEQTSREWAGKCWDEDRSEVPFCEVVAEKIREAFHAGLECGVRRFAWWQDGFQHVGTCGTSLSEALRDIDAELDVTCPHRAYRDEDGVEYCRRCGVAKAARNAT